MDQDTAIDFGLGREGVDDDRAGLDTGDIALDFPLAVNDARRGTRRRVSTYISSHRGPSALDTYFRALRRFPTLSDKEGQLALAREIKAAEAEGRIEDARKLMEQFLLGHLRMSIAIAKRMRLTGEMPLEDRIQYGNMGLLKAVEKFDPNRGCKFFTFAKPKVKRAIQQGDENTGKTIRLPYHIIEGLRKLAKVVRQHERESGETPTAEQIAEAMGVPVKKVNKLLEVRGQEALTILDAIEPGETESLLHKSLGADETTPEDLAVKRDMARKLNAAVDRLDKRQAEVIRLAFGLGTGAPLNDPEVADKMGISRSFVEALRRAGLKALKDMEELGDFREAV